MNNLIATQSQNLQNNLTEQDQLLKARKEAREEAQKDMVKPEIKWLTENSRKFLKSGYLTGDTTPEERIMEILGLGCY